MVGKRQFDETRARQGLVKAFTAFGFHGASLSQIEEYTGLQRSSLYNSFGSKSALFQTAMEDYFRSVEVKFLEALEGTGLVEGFRTVFDRQLAGLAAAGDVAGCLTTCAMNEMPYEDKDVQSAVQETVRLLLDRIGKRLNQAVEDGELAASTNLIELRDFLFGATRTIPFLYRSDPTGSASRHFANGAIEMLAAKVART
ncbi:MAG: TetR/AcrR family transcriptional regulator [Pseudomonadota bacterium]